MGVTGFEVVPGDIRDHAALDTVRLHPGLHDVALLVAIQFPGNCDLDLAGNLGILALLDRFDRVPQLPPIENPIRCICRRKIVAGATLLNAINENTRLKEWFIQQLPMMSDRDRTLFGDLVDEIELDGDAQSTS